MSTVNKAIIVGRLGRDPELRYIESGKAVCNMSVATDESWKGKDGEKHEKTEWHRVNVWGRTAENCAEYLAKGSLVYVEGRLQTREYEKDGTKRYSTEIVAQSVQFLGGKGGGEAARRPAPDAKPETGTPDFSGGAGDDDPPF